jgi:holliday junction DNA helicase RuvA
MIGYLQGKVLFSDGEEAIILTANGVGYTVLYNKSLVENTDVSFFIGQIIREDSSTLFAFDSYLDKKVFELLLKVNGVGPKSAYSLVTGIGTDGIIKAVQLESPQILKKAPGVGPKAAAQILLTLKDKIHLLVKYQTMSFLGENRNTSNTIQEKSSAKKVTPLKLSSLNEKSNRANILNDSMEALTQLGFKDFQVLPLVKDILEAHNEINKSEDLVQKVLKSL